MNSAYRIELLGGLRLRIGERAITRFRTQKNAVLLAYLAYFRHQQHPRELLLELLWPDCDPTAGRARLSNALCSLRHQLEPPGTPAGSVLQATHFAIGLNPAVVTTDVAEFVSRFRRAARTPEADQRLRLLRQAAALYQGELLPGFYDDWVLTEQRRLADLYEQVERLLHAADLKAGTVTAEVPALPETEAAAPDASASSLPVSFTRFFGRESELARLQEWLSPLSQLSPRPRLVTLTGAGGTGKTRLSLEVAHRLMEVYSDSVWFVSLTDLRDPSLLGSSLVEALSLPRSGQIEPLDQAIIFLRALGQPALLVLDNFEQVVEGGAAVVQTLLERVPALTVLATSRRLLNLSFECEFVLRPLPTPEGTEPLERLSLYESVRLFIDRAQTVRPDFQVTERNAPVVAELCQKLEGVPLAIELAAARSQVLTPSQMLSLMAHRFDFLVSKKRDVSGRHQSLWATLDWSYRLLSPELQRFFARLSVFRDGWTLEAAEAVCAEPQSLEYLEQLREWSLVLVEETEQGMRFRMLDSIREYAEARRSTEECTAVHRRFADYFSRVCFDWPEWSNIRSALDIALEWGDTMVALRLASGLPWYWTDRTEGCRILAGLLSREEAAEPTGERANALFTVGGIAQEQDGPISAHSYLAEALEIYRTLENSQSIAHTLDSLAAVAESMGDYVTARSLSQEAICILRQLGEEQSIPMVELNLARIACYQGDYVTARTLFQKIAIADKRTTGYCQIELARVARLEGDFDLAYDLAADYLLNKAPSNLRRAQALPILGEVALHRGKTSEAFAHYAESLSIFGSIGHKTGVSCLMRRFAALAFVCGQPNRAARLYGVEEALRQQMRLHVPPIEQMELATQVSALRELLGKNDFSSAWEAGRAMTWEQAVAYALEET